MLSRLSRRLTYANVMSTIAVILAVGTGGAYAANTIGSSDIIDGQVNSADVKDESLTTFDVSTFLGADVVDGTLTGADVADNSLTNADVKDLGNGDFLDGSVDSRVVTDNSLTGADINESSLVGVKDACHAGAVLFGRLCAGSDSGNRTSDAAFNFCASIGLRLPTLGEAVSLAINYDVPGVVGGDYFHTDEFTSDGRLIVAENGNIATGNPSSTYKTVCVETPTNL